MAYTYRFIDKEGKISYVGKTTSMSSRMAQHFGGKGHLPSECYKNVARIEYQKHDTESDALIYEEYYICKYNTKYNKLGKSRDLPTIELADKNWKLYKQLRPFSEKRIIRNTGLWRLIAIVYIIFVILYFIF